MSGGAAAKQKGSGIFDIAICDLKRRKGVDNREAVEASRPGLPLRLPWVTCANQNSNPNRGWVMAPMKNGTTPSGLETFVLIVSQGSRSGNPGLEVTTPMGLASLLDLLGQPR